jgi:hypothetical protein
MKKSLLVLLTFLLVTHASAQKGDYVFRLEMMGRKPVMNMMTSKTFACSNYGIYIRQGWSRDTLNVNILGIDSRRACNNVIEKARQTVEISGIREEEFVLRIRDQNKVNFFRVQFDGESFTVTPEQTDFIRYITN